MRIRCEGSEDDVMNPLSPGQPARLRSRVHDQPPPFESEENTRLANGKCCRSPRKNIVLAVVIGFRHLAVCGHLSALEEPPGWSRLQMPTNSRILDFCQRQEKRETSPGRLYNLCFAVHPLTCQCRDRGLRAFDSRCFRSVARSLQNFQ